MQTDGDIRTESQTGYLQKDRLADRQAGSRADGQAGSQAPAQAGRRQKINWQASCLFT
eukprot:COSAG02_NODE_43518_length_374_cov_0.560000_1_plen_57_part_10